MELSWLKSPFDVHDNVLFEYIKKSLVDSQIYGTHVSDFPFSDKAKKFRLRLSNCYQEVKILVNDIEWILFDGSVSSDGILDFYLLPKLGRNEVKVVSLDGLVLHTYLNFSCYNAHIFLGFMSYSLKTLWNKVYQALANIYISDNKVQNLDGDSLTPEYKFTRAFAILMGTKRYSGLTNSQYYTFLTNVFEMNEHGGTLGGYYVLQKALPDYIDRVDIVPLESHLVQRNELYGKVYVNEATDNTKLVIYPAYIYQSNNEWAMLPYFYNTPDATTNFTFYVYTDGELYGEDSSNYGSLKIKFSNDAEFFKREFPITDIFLSDDFRTDGTNEFVTGFESGKYVVLRNPIVDGTMLNIDTTGSILVDDSAIFLSDYNFVELGTRYEDEIDNVKVTYNTYDITNVLAKVTKDTTTGEILNIMMSGHPVYGSSRYLPEFADKRYLSYYEHNYGSVVLIIRAKEKIDTELKDILNILIRNILPFHLRYYLIFSTINLWDYAGDTHFVFSDTTTGIWEGITMGDLK